MPFHGINLATTKIVAEEIALGNIGNIKKVVHKSLIFCLLFSGIGSLLLIFCAPYVCSVWLHNKITCVPFYIISVSLPFISMSSCISGYFTAVRNSIKPACDQIFEQILKVFLISFLLNYFMPSGLEYICISLVLGNIIAEILSFCFIYTLYNFDKRKYDKYSPTNSFFEKRILGITIPVGLTSCIRSGLSTLKQVLIPIGFEKSGNSYEKALANYGLISGMAMPLVLFPNIIVLTFSNLLIPEFTEFNTRSDYSKINRISRKILKYTTFFSVAISVILFIYAEKLSYFMYKTTDVAIYVKLLSPLIPIMYIDNVVDAILKGLDKQVTVLKINILDLFTSILLIFLVIPKFGVMGYVFIIYFSELLNFGFSFGTLARCVQLWTRPNYAKCTIGNKSKLCIK